MACLGEIGIGISVFQPRSAPKIFRSVFLFFNVTLRWIFIRIGNVVGDKVKKELDRKYQLRGALCVSTFLKNKI